MTRKNFFDRTDDEDGGDINWEPPNPNDPPPPESEDDYMTGQVVPLRPAKPQPPALWMITEPWQETDIPLRPWIARGYIMRGSVSVISGPGSAGKSSLMIAIASAAAIGASFGHIKIAAKLRVAVYNVEDDANEQRRRFSAMFRRLNVPIEQIAGQLAIIGPTHVGTLLSATREGRVVVNTEAMNQLEAFVQEFRPDILGLDPFVELHAAEENDNTAVRAVMARFRAMAAEYDMGVIIFHHTRKGIGAPGDPESLRGASAIVGAARVVLTLNVMTEEEAKATSVPPTRRHDYFRLDHAKSNYAPIGDAEWFQRIEIKLGNGTTDKEPDGVAVAWPWTPPKPFANTTPAELNIALDLIDQGLPDGQLYSSTRRGGSTRWAGQALVDACEMTPEAAAEMVKAWLQSGLLFKMDGTDKWNRPTSGVKVNHTKRPTI